VPDLGPGVIDVRITPRSFKARLVLTTTVVFIAAGAALAVGQLVVLDAALNRNIGQMSIGDQGPASGTSAGQGSAGPNSVQWPPPGCPSCDPTGLSQLRGSDSSAPSNRVWDLLAPGIMRDSALGGLLLLVGFAAVTAGLAWWLARRALARVGEVTALAREISEHDLSRRIHLPGPPDEIRELADTIDVMLTRLQGAFESQERFVANASHELRGPLTASRTALEAPLAQGRFPAGVVPSVQRALEANKRSERLITALLQLARSRAVADAESTSQDLAQIAEDAVAAVADEAQARGIGVQQQVEGPVTLSGNATLLAQAAFNLVDNAVRHSNERGHVRVHVSATVGTARLAVENTGTVYTPEEAEQLKEPFHRGRQTRLADHDGRQGLGLGLALVDAIARAHRGRLDVTPRPAGGLVVELVLPV
jgi:signal transduction histidine kinase